MLLVDVVLELVAAVLAVGAEGALVLRLAAALERDVAHEVAARVVGALALRALVPLLSLALAQREVRARVARRKYIVRRFSLLLVVGGVLVGFRRRQRVFLILLGFFGKFVGRRYILKNCERFRRLLRIVFITTCHHSSLRRGF